MRWTRTVRAAVSGSIFAAYEAYGRPARAATPTGTIPATPSELSTPANTRPNSRVWSAAASTRVVATTHDPARAGSDTSTPRVAPIASALRIVAGPVAGASESRMTAPSPAA